MFPWKTSLFFFISRNISKVARIYIYIYPTDRFTEEKSTLEASTRYTVNVRSGRHAPIAQRGLGMTKREISRGGEGGREGEEENKVAWFINNSIWSRTFVERHLRRRSRFFPVSSRYRLHFTPPISGARASQRLCLRYFSFGYAFGIVIYFLPACLSLCLSLCARLRHPREEI